MEKVLCFIKIVEFIKDIGLMIIGKVKVCKYFKIIVYMMVNIIKESNKAMEYLNGIKDKCTKDNGLMV